MTTETPKPQESKPQEIKPEDWAVAYVKALEKVVGPVAGLSSLMARAKLGVEPNLRSKLGIQWSKIRLGLQELEEVMKLEPGERQRTPEKPAGKPSQADLKKAETPGKPS